LLVKPSRSRWERAITWVRAKFAWSPPKTRAVDKVSGKT
jgi:hypothetical protein